MFAQIFISHFLECAKRISSHGHEFNNIFEKHNLRIETMTKEENVCFYAIKGRTLSVSIPFISCKILKLSFQNVITTLLF